MSSREQHYLCLALVVIGALMLWGSVPYGGWVLAVGLIGLVVA